MKDEKLRVEESVRRERGRKRTCGERLLRHDGGRPCLIRDCGESHAPRQTYTLLGSQDNAVCEHGLERASPPWAEHQDGVSHASHGAPSSCGPC